MIRRFTLEYWIDAKWHVGRLKEIPGVFSQGKTLKELQENIRDAYFMLLQDENLPGIHTRTKEIGIKVV